MKVHYINILLFALALNILDHSKNKLSIITHYTPTTRLLCECELYAPANYDNDLEMKEVMQQFEDRTSQRFQEYEERLQDKRQKCKDKCDKEIQKIILKDKLEKELMDKFATLQTDIQSDAIPTCICEKSLADKTENFCLNCGKTMGGVAPGWGLVGGLMYAGWTKFAATTLVKMATDAGIKAGVNVGLANVIKIATQSWGIKPSNVPTIEMLAKTTTGISAKDVTLHGILETINSNGGALLDEGTYSLFSGMVQVRAQNTFSLKSFSTEAQAVSTAFNKAKEGILAEGTSKTSSLTTGITASVVAIIVIVLIMVIIYLILRYRRKKKMKKLFI
ncbi:rifin [Plasmodium reichenowi]|uniref:Rifin n=1 Tax=Plasmodium reichenowi TaxID=5854 RepID=A0A060RQG1_PLARE|nr:rifin [Plasmodium reichenowi]